MLYREIAELYETPSRKDVFPVSGYLVYDHGEREQNITIQSIDDNEEESAELFRIRLTSAKGGARIDEKDAAAILTG